tara:strand:+ start:5304 stop:5555 length:252 start_codon:yes stop_codon:yes gene_type:complete
MLKYISNWFNLPNTLLIICNKLDRLYEKLVEIQQLVEEEYTYEESDKDVQAEPEVEPETTQTEDAEQEFEITEEGDEQTDDID